MKYGLTDNTCVMCGAEIPEGRQVCPACEERVYSRANTQRRPKQERNTEESKNKSGILDEIRRWVTRK